MLALPECTGDSLAEVLIIQLNQTEPARLVISVVSDK